MGSKKPKRKKLKPRKLNKNKKFKESKSIRNEKPDFRKKTFFEDNLLQNKTYFDRLTDKKMYSRSCINETYISKVINFSQIREYYFNYLQRVLTDNCVFSNSHVTKDVLENLSLEIEQYALLACLQANIYENSMNKIITDIKKCTEEKQIHHEVKKLLPELPEKEIFSQNKPEAFNNSVSTCEAYSQIPIISNTRVDYGLNGYENEWSENAVYSPNLLTAYVSSKESDSKIFEDTQEKNNLESWMCTENYSESIDISQWNNIQAYEANENSTFFKNSVPQSFTDTQIEDDFSKQNVKTKPVSRVTPQALTENKVIDPLFESRNQLLKSVEQTLMNTEKIKKQKKEEKERAFIAHILEGEDSLDGKYNDSLSDNEIDTKDNFEENLTERLEKMRELFGMEEDNKSPVVNFKTKLQNDKVSSRPRRPTMWRHEKIIQLYKFSMLSSEMTSDRKAKNKMLFLELFDEDSDEEHELEYRSEEKYRNSCIERISSWVVKYLMPYYHDKRIIGRQVFKTLGHYISNAIVDKIQYPDEWTVKYLVSKFFPSKKVYFSDADVLTSQID